VTRAATPTRTRALAVVALVGVLGGYALSIAGGVQAASVPAIPVDSGNPTCADFGSGWKQLKVDQLGNGTFSDGSLAVTISHYQDSSSSRAGSFDWRSNIGVDAVFVKAGSDKHNLYRYDPEATSDTDLGPQDGRGNGISHISFCYDAVDAATPSPTTPPSTEPTPSVDPTPSTEPTPTTEPTPSVEPTPSTEPTPSVDPTPKTEPTPSTDPTPSTEPTPSVEPTPSTDPSPNTDPTPSVEPSPSVEPTENTDPTPSTDPSVEPTENTQPSETPDTTGDVAGAVGTPAPTLPATDTLPATTDQGTPLAALLIVISGIATTALVVRHTARARR